MDKTFSGQWQPEVKIDDVQDADTFFQISAEGWGFGLHKRYGCVPKVGDRVQLYNTHQFSRLLGIKINGEVLFQHSDEAAEALAAEEREKIDTKKKAEYEAKKAEYEAAYQALPAAFRVRIDRLRSKNPNFNWEYLPYELFVSTEAHKITKHFKTREQLTEFAKLEIPQQKLAIPELEYEEHSGNTFGEALQQASIFTYDPAYLKFYHGALVGLVGCDGYGCHPLTNWEKAEFEALCQAHEKEEGSDDKSQPRA
jgi:hypothetical protein